MAQRNSASFADERPSFTNERQRNSSSIASNDRPSFINKDRMTSVNSSLTINSMTAGASLGVNSPASSINIKQPALQQDGPNDSASFGVNNYEQKQKIIGEYYSNHITAENVQEMGQLAKSLFTEALPSVASEMAQMIKYGLTPPFIQQFYAKKIHVKQIESNEKKFNELNELTRHTIAADLKFKREKQAREKMIKEYLEEKRHLRDKVKAVMEAAEEQHAEEQFQAFHRRREMQLAELVSKLELEKKAQQEQEERVKSLQRTALVDFYRQQAATDRKELSDYSFEATQLARNKALLDRTFDEWESRDFARTRLQVEVPPASAPIGIPGAELGIFGIAHEEVQRVQKLQQKRLQAAKARDVTGASSSSSSSSSSNRKVLSLVAVDEEDEEDDLGGTTNNGDFDGDDALYLEEVDQPDIHPFDAPPHEAYEVAMNAMNDMKAELTHSQQLYDAIQYGSKNLHQAVQKMADMKEKLERDQREIGQEILTIQKVQQGPPRRLAMKDEIHAMDAWKSQYAKLHKKINELQYSIDKSEEKKRVADKQLMSLAQSIAVIEEKCKSKEMEMNTMNGDRGLGLLPMIVGRNLGKVPGMGITGNPQEVFRAISHKSRLVTIRQQSDVADGLHKERNQIEQKIWVARQGEASKKEDLDRIVSRITSISERLQKSKVSDLRLNIIDSLKGFFASGLKLNAVKRRVVGLLPWFKHSTPSLCKDTVKYVAKTPMGAISFELYEDQVTSESFSYGVTLGAAKSGHNTGVVLLPKNCLWNLSLTVSRQGQGDKYVCYDSEDFVRIHIGDTVTSLNLIATVYNVVNPSTGSVLYDVKHLYKGKSFAFRFDFSSSSDDPLRHLCVSTGIYEEYEAADLEMISDPKKVGRTRVLSSYVKEMKYEYTYGKLREIKLLEELISAESVKDDHWDSDILTQIRQRYPREYFLRILKAELLLQQEVRRKQVLREQEEQVKAKLLMADADLRKEAALEQSKKKYVMKKRLTQRKKLDEGKDLVGKRLILWDEAKKAWRNVTVEDFVVRWVDNGLTATVTHLVQEYTDAFEPIAVPKEVNLSLFKWFQSPVQEIDAQTMKRNREKKRWEDAITDIDRVALQEIDMLKSELDDYRRSQEQLFKRSKKRIMKAFERTLMQRAKDTADSSVATRALKVLASEVMEDIKKGIVDVPLEEGQTEPTKKQEKEVAKTVARERFIDNWIDDQRVRMETDMREKEGEMKEDLDEKTHQFEVQKHAIMEHAQADQKLLKSLIRKQLAQRKEVLLRRVRFDPNIFKKVIPQAALCEHLKTKSWGDNYSSGIRCVQCGKELSELHLDESQARGYGSGTDPQLYEAVKRHRENEQSFRFTSAEQLAAVEEERIRLEKERRVMDLDEGYFYDYQDLPVVYDFDRRHAVSIKAAGVFRQGLQWKEYELEYYEQSKINREKERLEREGLPESLLDGFDPLSAIQEPPPTFRAAEEKHKAQYNQLVYSIGRLHNFNRRINEFKNARLEILLGHDLYEQVLELLHKDSYLYESQLIDLEKDLDRTSLLISTYQKMQVLWQQASLIQRQAEKEKAKAEMARVGVWEDVKECQDRTSILHDETRALLRFKLTTDAKLDYHEKSLKIRMDQLKICIEKYESSHYKAESLRYCMPGNLVYTRYGQCYISGFRQRDDMLIVLLPFGNPRAKAYIHYKEVVDIEKAKQQGERLLMDLEDIAMQSFVTKERIIIKKELYLMRKAEEGMREYCEFIDLGKQESGLLQRAVDEVVQEKYAITESKVFKSIQKPTVDGLVSKEVEKRKQMEKDYIGPPSGRPKAMTWGEIAQQRKLIVAELNYQYVSSAANMVDTTTKAALERVRSNWLQRYSFEALIDAVVKETIYEVAAEAYHEGRNAKGFAEKKSGIVFPQTSWMQYSTYSSLSSIINAKKEGIKFKIETRMGDASRVMSADSNAQSKSKLSLEPEEVAKRRKLAKLRKIELARQERLNEEMRREELLSRTFYRWELRENLRERRQMREDDRLAADIRTEEKRRKREELEAYLLLHAGGTDDPAGGMHLTAAQKAEVAAKNNLTYEKRRQELKDLTIERRRREEDRAMMIIEDEQGKHLRELDKFERQQAQYKKEFGSDDDEEEEVDEEGAEANVSKRRMEDIGWLDMMIMKKKLIPVPDWCTVPRGFYKWTIQAQNKYLRMKILVNAKQKQIDKNVIKENKFWVKFENKSYEDWELKYQMFEIEELKDELAMMEADEILKEFQAKLEDVKNNMKKILLYCRDKGEEELKSRTELKRKEEIARLRDKELAEASAWLDLCTKRARTRDKLKRKVYADCKWIDTDSVNGFHQRYSTELLRERLYLTYFDQIVESIVNRSEIIATERKLLGLQELLSINKAQLMNRKKGMQELLSEIRRDEYMRMRRSMLNEKLFGQTRRAVLLERFSSWVRFFMWNRGNKEAFQLRYEVVKRQLDIDRQFKEQLQTQKERDRVKLQSGGHHDSRSLMQKHSERTIQCRNCLKYYLESQNTSVVCEFHPKQFVMECPSTCSSPGLTAMCSAHRKLRWTCCDSTNNSAIGCCRRYHQPPPSDPVYDKIMDKIIDRDADAVSKLDNELVEARKNDWHAQLNHAKRTQIFKIEDVLHKDRETAGRYANLKFV